MLYISLPISFYHLYISLPSPPLSIVKYFVKYFDMSCQLIINFVLQCLITYAYKLEGPKIYSGFISFFSFTKDAMTYL